MISAAVICGAKAAAATLVFAMITVGAAIDLPTRALAFCGGGVGVGIGIGALTGRVIASAGAVWRGFSGDVIGAEGSPVVSGRSGFEMLTAGISTAPKVVGCGLFSGVSTKGNVVEIGVVCGTVGAEVSADGLSSVGTTAVGYVAAASGGEIGGAVRTGPAARIGGVCRIGWVGMTMPAARQASAVTAVVGGLGLSSCAASAARKPGASERSSANPRGPKARICKS